MVDGIPGQVLGIVNGNGRERVVPVVTSNNNGLLSEVVSREAEIVGAERAVSLEEVMEVVYDSSVESDVSAWTAEQVTSEETKRRVELLKYDGLGLNFADLLGDDPERKNQSKVKCLQ